MDTKMRIIDATIAEYSEKGFNFTMDDITRRIGISKKTLYKIFDSKEALFNEMVDSAFADIRELKRDIINSDMEYYEKVREILIAIPPKYQGIGLESLYELPEKFPNVYRHLIHELDSEWESTIAFLNRGIEEKRLKEFDVMILKIIVGSSLSSFLSTNVLKNSHISYDDARNAMMDIVMKGIEK